MEKLSTDIAEIKNTAIVFNDGERIDLIDCIRNNMKGDTRCVAERDITADPPYFKFCCAGEPRIIFKFSGLFAKKKTEKAFHELSEALLTFGYTTFDLS